MEADDIVMNRLPGVLNVISQPRNEEDFVDRLNYKTTTYIVLAAALTIFAKEYGGDPIRCWADATWPDAWVQYAHDICFVENTYFVNGSIPRNQQQRRFHQIGYYQWIPFILVLQAIFCNLPHLFWRSLNWTSGLQLRAVVTMANEARKTGPLAKANVRDTVARHIHDGLLAKAMYLNMGRNGSFVLRAVRLITHLVSPSYLATLYCISKVLNVANAVMQVWMLGHFLGQSSHFWGFSMLSAMQRGETWEDTGLFPRVVVCDFQVRDRGMGQMDHIQTKSIQCVLTANLINEKIFTGLWWWLQLLTAISVVNTIQWMYRLWSSDARQDFLASILQPSVDLVLPSLEDVPVDESIRSGETNEESLNTDSCDDSGVRSASPMPPVESDTSREGVAERREKERCAFRDKIECEIKNFEKFVGADGILVLRLIQSNAGEFFTSAVVGKIFHEFQPDSMKDENGNFERSADA